MAKFCVNCGTELQDNQQVCLKCGKLVSDSKEVNQVGAKGKSKIAAGILGILLGAFGIHNFYLGYTGKGVAQLLITVLSCGMLAVVSEIWGLVEGIQILTGSITTDANGDPLSE